MSWLHCSTNPQRRCQRIMSWLHCSTNGLHHRPVMDLPCRAWDLRCKEQSAEVLACKDCADNAVLSEKWMQISDSTILGWLVQSDGGMSRAWSVFKAKLMGAFYANLRAPGFKKLSTIQRTSMLGRALGPIALYYAQPWQPSFRVAEDMNILQRRMVAMAVAVPRLPEEDWVAFVTW